MRRSVTERGGRETDRPAFVLLEDGEWFAGYAPYSFDPGFGEVVFTTNLSGYQETFTDPSYLGQIVVMTAPMIGNYGVTDEDQESSGPKIHGMVAREICKHPSNWRASGALTDWLAQHSVPVIEGVDTRRLTRHIRSVGAMRGVIAQGEAPTNALKMALQASPSMAGQDLATRATITSSYSKGATGPHVVAIDAGMKDNILKMLVAEGCRVTVVPATTSAEEILRLNPTGIFISNGPGDPEAITYLPPVLSTLAACGIPVFGICLGHQLIGLAFGGHTIKMPYGHRGGNHPVKDLTTGRVLITSQNHGFAVAGSATEVAGAPDLEVTHINLNDGTIEGMRHRSLPVFSVQYHPEASPGPHDAYPHFSDFMRLLGQNSP